MSACAVGTTKFPGGRTGTIAGRKAHLRAGERVCEPCRAAYRVAKHRRRMARAGVDLVCEIGGRTGSRAGWRAHRMAREVPCERCADAVPVSEAEPVLLRMLQEALDAQPYSPRRGWSEDGACRGMNPGVFIATDPRRKPSTLAVSTCASCAVRRDCAAANSREDYGFWGGLTKQGRRLLLARQEAVDTAPPEILPLRD